MPDDPKAWMKKSWSICLIISGGVSGGSSTFYTSPLPFSATAEEANQIVTDFRDKVMSINSSPHDRPTPLIVYMREPGGENYTRWTYWTRDGTKNNGAVEQRYFKPVVDEVIIPASLLRGSFVRVSLLEEMYL